MLRLALLLLAFVAAPALAGPGTVGVLYFENQGNPDLEPLKVGLTQMLITDLRGTPGVTVIERTRLQAILDELALGHEGPVDPATAARVGQLLGAEWLVLGSYFELMGTLRIDARLVRVETGEIAFAHGVDDRRQAFMALEDAVAAALREALTAAASTQPAPAPATAPEPTRGAPAPTEAPVELARPDADALAAAVALSEGLIALDRRDLTRARASFERAVAAEPALEEARAQLAALSP